MQDDRERTPRWWVRSTLLVVGPLVGVIAGWWLSAESAREEGLRVERREAYVSILTNASDCTFRGLGRVQEDLLQDLADEGDEFAQEILEHPDARQLLDEISLSVQEQTECRARLRADVARIGVVTDSDQVRRAAVALGQATTATFGTGDIMESLNAYDDATANFETYAHINVNEPVPFLPRSLTGFIARIIVSGFIAWMFVGVPMVVIGYVSRWLHQRRSP